MKRLVTVTLLSVLAISQLQANETKEQRISNPENRKSISVSKTSFSKYFTGGEVRIDRVYPKSDTNTHSGSYVTFEPGSRTNWHSHPAGQHIIVTSGVGYYQAWGKPIQVIKPGDVVWVPIGLKHWHGASKDIAMTHLVITSIDKNGKNVEWLEPVSDTQYNSK